MIEETIEKVLYYAKKKLYLPEEDTVFFENLLLHFFEKDAPVEANFDKDAIDDMEVPDALVDEIVAYETKERGVDEEEALRRADYVFGLLEPRPQTVNDEFYSRFAVSDIKALDYLYDLSIKSYYLQKSKVDKNLEWSASYKDGPSLEITINLSKPEKNNKDIAKLIGKASSDYPKCRLCPSNLGVYGDGKHPARTSIRFVPIKLAGEDWYLQYSPYGYFKKHCIAFKKEHSPMIVEPTTWKRLLDFVDLFPSFFMGSNADLPIVGGSILDHLHFQGGLPVLPLFDAKPGKPFHTTSRGTSISVLDFYDTCLYLEGLSKEDLIDTASKILAFWQGYSDIGRSIVAVDEKGKHNTITGVARKQGMTYSLYLILRNNITTEQYPEGLFHAHPEYFPIKHEGIGLIEAAGLFILPARLKRQLAEAKDSASMSEKEYLEKYPDMKDFKGLIDAIKGGMEPEEYINGVCQGILRNVAVFKDDEDGKKGLDTFLNALVRSL